MTTDKDDLVVLLRSIQRRNFHRPMHAERRIALGLPVADHTAAKPDSVNDRLALVVAISWRSAVDAALRLTRSAG